MRHYIESSDNRLQIETKWFCETSDDIEQLDISYLYDIVGEMFEK